MTVLHSGHDRFKYREVEHRVLSMIESGALSPGDKLPSLRLMGKRMGVSVSTVSQAYMELEAMGAVEARERSGFYVSATTRSLARLSVGPTDTICASTVSRNKLISNVLEVVGSRNLVSLGVAFVDVKLMPVKTISRMMATILRERGEEAINYEVIPGNMDLRNQIAGRMARLGVPATSEDVLVTSGALEGVYIALRILTKPGDNVLIQSPTYYCFLQLMETLGLRAIEIPSCPDQGVDPGDVAEAVKKFDISACIFTPNFNNPDGSLTSEENKREIARILAEKNIPLVEDDVNGDMHLDEKRPGTYRQYDEKGLVIHVSSFSKTLCPGYRVGWIMPGRFIEKAFEIKATTNVSCATPSQLVVAEYLRSGQYERHLRKLRQTLRNQRDTLRMAVARSFPEGTRATVPGGGTELWIELPGDPDCIELFIQAKKQGIGICPGTIFSTNDRFKNFIRMSYGNIWSETIENAVRKVGELATDLVPNG